MSKRKQLKIFIGLQEIAGHYTRLHAGFKELGFWCDYVNLNRHPFDYGSASDQWNLVRIIRALEGKGRALGKNPRIAKRLFLILGLLFRVMLFCYVAPRYDVFIFGFGSSFLYLYDLPILRLMRKTIIFRFHGSDCRPPYLSGGIALSVEEPRANKLITMTVRKKRKLRRIECYANAIVSNPLFSHLLEKPFLSGPHIGLPFATELYNQNANINKERFSMEGLVRIVHSPSNPIGKGTPIIRDIISTLNHKVIPVELVEIKDQPNEVVINELAQCDFAIDQLYSDTPMAAFAGEAAVLSKPVVVGANGYEEFERIYPEGKTPPTCWGPLASIPEIIAQLAEDREYRLQRGRIARKFVEDNWTAQKVASRYVRIITGDVPREWWFDPKETRYLFGAGMPKEKTRETVRSIIEKSGISALQLSDKPMLEKMFYDFAFLGDVSCLDIRINDYEKFVKNKY